MLISVVIPTLNTRPQFLKEALNSIEKQSYLPSEVIIVNNGIEDLKLPETSLNIRQFKIVFKSGVAQARNFGASISKGNYIAFLDDDDLWGQDYLKNMKNKLI
jgi:glycosyltransferase involved in cell wall biosynthesis